MAALLLILVVTAYAVDASHDTTIARGVRVGGVDVGGMTTSKARTVLAARLGPVVSQPVVATYAGRRFVLSAQDSGVRPDVDASARAALERSRGGWFVGRALDDALGNSVQADVPAQVIYSQVALDGFVSSVASALDRQPQDASVAWSGAGPRIVHESAGVAVNTAALRRSVATALVGTGPRSIAVGVSTQPARLTADQLPARYPAAVVVDRSGFTLRLYEHLKLSATYPIAVGMQGLQTPAGLYDVQDKQVNPSWSVPNSSWAGSLAGHVIPPGPQDPLKARWIGFDGSAGIHGIDPSEYGTIGQNASHGCVRMTIPDVIALYSQVKVGDPVYIA